MAGPSDAIGLENELGAEPPRGLVDALTLAELHMLATSLGEAKWRQSRALDIAIQDALGHVPFVFRGAVELVLT